MSASQTLLARRYRLLHPLGAGGMGKVWFARDEILHRDVAVKEVVPPPGLTPDERDEMRRRTFREARAAARLNHPNVVRVYDVVTEGDRPWIVMEYVQSRSLHQIITEEGPLEPARVAQIGLGVLGALRAAHRAGVLHRDVKPGNVLLTEDGRVVLTDFGLATLEGEATVTRPGLVLGSPAYMAPERARDGHGGAASDLWGLGATLYAAVEGHSPYQRSNAMATLTALATEPPDPPRRASGSLRRVLVGLLDKDPHHRLGVPEAERLLLRAASGSALQRFPGLPRPRRQTSAAPATVDISTPRPPVLPGAVVAAPASPAPPTAGGADSVPAGTAEPSAEPAPAARRSVSETLVDAPLASAARPAAAEALAAPRSVAETPVTAVQPVTDVQPATDVLPATAAQPGIDGQPGTDRPPDTDLRPATDPWLTTDARPPVAGTRATDTAVDAMVADALVTDVPAQAAPNSPSTTPTAATPTPTPAAATPAAATSTAAAATSTAAAAAATSTAAAARSEASARPLADTSVDAPARTPAGRTGARAAAPFIPQQPSPRTATSSPARPAPPPPPATPPPTTVAPVRPLGPDGRPERRRRGVVILAVLLALAIVAVLLVTLWPERRPSGQAGQSPAASSAAAPSSAAPSAAASQSSAAPSASASAPTTGAGFPVPAGWHRYTDTLGWSVAVPDGWTKETRGTIVYFHGPKGQLLGIDHGEPAKPDPVADWTTQRNRRVAGGDFPGYQEWKLAAVPYFVSAADWEFSYNEGGQRVHANNRGFVTTAAVQAHAVWWSTPEDQWQANLPALQTVYDSFTPIQH